MLSYFSRQKTAANKWEHSSAGRASALQAEGHRFEPYCSHHYGLVVQLVRTLACHARGRRFDPDPGRQFASVAQSVEQGTENPRVIGSIPIGGTICGRSSSGRAPPCQGGGSEFEPRRPLQTRSHCIKCDAVAFFAQSFKIGSESEQEGKMHL